MSENRAPSLRLELQQNQPERRSAWKSPRIELPDEDAQVLVAVVREADDHDGIIHRWVEVRQGLLYRGGGDLVALTADDDEFLNEDILGWMALPEPPELTAP
jgi:hypothetical protein